MNYQKILIEKNLKLEDLSKKIKDKINALENLTDKLQETASELDEEKIEEYKEVIKGMDDEIVSDLKKFKLEVHQKRLQMAEKARLDRQKKSESAEKDDDEFKELDKKSINVKKLDENLNVEKIKREKKERKKIEEAEVEEIQEVDAEEISEEEAEEFEKKAEIKPKKSFSIGVALFGLGIFIASWGAITIWKSKR